MPPASTDLARRAPDPGGAGDVPRPPGEAVRLLALRASGLLHAPADPRLIPLLHGATRLFDLPVAAVSLLDRERQHLHAAVGLDRPDLPRAGSFCAQAILEHDQVLVVEDAVGDPRFRANPLVASAPGLRFYAGVPVLTGAGQALGTCWVADTRPRRLTPRSFARLTELAVRAAALLRLRTELGERQKHRPRGGRRDEHAMDPALDAVVEAAASRILAVLEEDGSAAAIEAVLQGWAGPDGRLGDAYRHRVHALCELLYRLHRQGGDPRVAVARHAVLAAAW